LELSCGTGRILIELAATGLDVCGLDLSAGMLAYAAEKAAAKGITLELHQRDMRSFDLGKTFAAISLPNNALGHLYTRGDLEAHFAAFRRHLKPDGVYLLDMFVPKPAYLTPDSIGSSRLGQYIDPTDGAVIDITQTGYYIHATQIKHAV
jgi:SAM-dependent methyltransferase